MSLPYSPVPVILPDTITLLQDVVDDVVVETVNPPFQDVANAARLAGDICNSYGRGKIANEDVAPGDQCGIEAPSFDSGLVTVDVGTNTIEIDDTGSGVYLFSFSLFVTKADATLLGADLLLDTNPGFAVVLAARAAPDGSGSGWLTASGIVKIGDSPPGGGTFTLLLRMLTGGADDYTIADDGQISVNRIR